MDPESSCSKPISLCESSSGSVHKDEIVAHVKVQNIDFVMTQEQEVVNDSRIEKDGVSCHEAVVESDDTTLKEKSKEFHLVVDVSSGGGGERICRICHFGSSDQSLDDDKLTSVDLIEIGCKCKNELGLAHLHCAEAWFKLKGNNVCEICGCTAKNVTVSSREGWNEERDNTIDERRRRGRGQSCCIFIFFLLTIVLLHWFFKRFSFYYKR